MIIVVVVVVLKHELEHKPHLETMNSPLPSTCVEHHGVVWSTAVQSSYVVRLYVNGKTQEGPALPALPTVVQEGEGDGVGVGDGAGPHESEHSPHFPSKKTPIAINLCCAPWLSVVTVCAVIICFALVGEWKDASNASALPCAPIGGAGRRIPVEGIKGIVLEQHFVMRLAAPLQKLPRACAASVSAAVFSQAS